MCRLRAVRWYLLDDRDRDGGVADGNGTERVVGRNRRGKSVERNPASGVYVPAAHDTRNLTCLRRIITFQDSALPSGQLPRE